MDAKGIHTSLQYVYLQWIENINTSYTDLKPKRNNFLHKKIATMLE